jgi:hypothetical protein
VLVFFQYYDNKSEKNKTLFVIAKLLAFLVAIILLWKLPFWSGKGFDFYKSDIIIMVLANMALFGTIIYFLTANQPMLRLGFLPFIMAIFLAAKEPANGWAKELFNINHIGELKFDWLYRFYFLKYLFIIIPGTIAGEWMIKETASVNKNSPEKEEVISPLTENILAAGAFALIILNLAGLFSRMLFINLVGTVFICFVLLYLVRKLSNQQLLKQMIAAGTYLLVLGLFFEAYEGGIKKDHSTYSYYFVSSGLAFFSLIVFTIFAKRNFAATITRYFSTNGKNPMVAYIAGNLLLLPLLNITHLKPYWDSMQQNFFMGLMKGVLFTALVSLITMFFVRRKWFWKT